MYAQVRHPWRTRPVRVIPKGRTCAAGSQLFAVLCLSATFDTTLAGTQQVHPCMLKCAILGAQGLYALYRKAELALLAPSSSQYFVYLPLSIQRLQARSKYIHVCSGAPSLAHKACTRYTERPKLRFWLPAPSSRLSALGSRLSALGSRLSALGSRLSALGSRLSALSSRLSALGSRLSALGSRLSALGSRLSALGSRLSALGSRLSALGSRLSALGSQLSALGSRLSALGSRLSALGSRLPAPSSQPSIFQTIIHPRLNPGT